MQVIEAGAEFIDERGPENVIVRDGQAGILFRNVKGTNRWGAAVGTEARAALLGGRGYLAVFICEASIRGLFRADVVVQAEVTLIAGNRRSKIVLIVVYERAGGANVLARQKSIEYVRRCWRNWNGIAGDGRAIWLINIRAGKIATQVGIGGLHAVNDPAHAIGRNAD